jgi:hypothetical protein
MVRRTVKGFTVHGCSFDALSAASAVSLAHKQERRLALSELPTLASHRCFQDLTPIRDRGILSAILCNCKELRCLVEPGWRMN